MPLREDSAGALILTANFGAGTASLIIGNTILHQNGAAGATLAVNGSSTITDKGYNISSDNGGGFLTATGDQINTNPLLGPLQNNGGPTSTHPAAAHQPGAR